MSQKKKDAAAAQAFAGATAKLTIGSLDETTVQVAAQYNPRELDVKKAFTWAHKKSTNKQAASMRMEYGGAEPATMSIDLLFDGVETEGKVKGKSITDLIATLYRLASPRNPTSKDPALMRPHYCVVAWGGDARPADGIPKLQCVIESVSVKYQMFSSKGAVMRATVSVQLKQADRLADESGGGRELVQLDGTYLR